MLDIKFIRENPEKVMEVCKAKQVKCEVERILELSDELKKYKTIQQQIDTIKNKGSERIGTIQDPRLRERAINDTTSEVNGYLVREKVDVEDEREIQTRIQGLEAEITKLQYEIPNIPLEGVPVGGKENNQVLRHVGKIPSFDFEKKDHLELGEAMDVIDMKRAAKVSGARFAYLKGDAVLLEFALVQLVLKEAMDKGFNPIIPPVLIKQGLTEGLGYWQHDGNEDYYLVFDPRCWNCNHEINREPKEIVCRECTSNDGRRGRTVKQVITEDGYIVCHNCNQEIRLISPYLVGTAEHTLVPMHQNETFEERDLPKRYVGFSTAFRREAGSYGKDTRGILRVHQFDKVEFVSFTTPEQSREEHKFLISLEEKLWQALGIPYQVVQLATGDSSLPSASTIDIEAWMPGQNKYREVSSASNTTDFQARRLNIRYHRRKGLGFVHILNATGFAIGRTLIAILENYQQKDGGVEIPKVLQGYMGKTKIERSA
ncbi:MAG: serine--tRNA ligase [Patescibacteria group bacterium]